MDGRHTMRILRALLIFAACIITWLMVVRALPISRHENVEYSRALYEHNKNPSETTRRELVRVRAADDRGFIIQELILGVPLIVLIIGLARATKTIRTRAI